MKSLLILLAAAVFVCASLSGIGQSAGGSASPSPAASSNGSADASSVPLPAEPVPGVQSTPAAGTTLENHMPLIPEPMPAGSAKPGKHGKGPKLGPGGVPAVTPPRETFDVEEDIRTRLHVRAAETEALKATDLADEWAAAHETRTDPGRRAALLKYYNQLFDRMVKIDPTIALAVTHRRAAVLDRMQYSRLGDLLPPEDPYATPTPVPSGPNPPVTDLPEPF